MDTGLIGGLVGSVIGVMGGLVGTFLSIRNTSGPREKAFTVKASIICWIAIIVFLALLFLLPTPWRFFLWIPYGILLPLGIVIWNRTQQGIREEESRNNRAEDISVNRVESSR